MNRNSFLSATATLVATSAAPALAQAVPGGSELVERKANFDEAGFARAVGRPAEIRQLFEAVGFNPTLLTNVKNSLNGLQFGFGYAPERITIAIGAHGPSTGYAFDDAMWAKYKFGAFIGAKDANAAPLTSNVFFKSKAPANTDVSPDDPKGMYQDAQVETLQRRGVLMLVCHTAVEEQSRRLVAAGFAPDGMQASAVADDLLTHLIPGWIVVPSMVATVAVLQSKYSYTYASLAF